MKKCVICEKEFLAYKRRNALTCSKECASLLRHRTHNPIINGKKKCALCGEFKNINEFYIVSKNKITCSYCNVCMTKATRALQIKRKRDAVRELGGKCSKCGYNKCIGALDFHHTDPSTKESVLGKLNSKRFYVELKKCILLCANCHREEHTSADGW